MPNFLKCIRDHVCTLCIDAQLDDMYRFIVCGLPAARECPIQIYLQDLVLIAQAQDGHSTQDYVREVRRRVCSKCQHDENGFCALRLAGDCALDRYLMLVCDALKSTPVQCDLILDYRDVEEELFAETDLNQG